MSEWVAVDDEKPPLDELVWINDEFYHGVTIGYYTGWWVTYAGSDDIGVTHWAPMNRPGPPE